MVLKWLLETTRSPPHLRLSTQPVVSICTDTARVQPTVTLDIDNNSSAAAAHSESESDESDEEDVD